MSGPELPPAGWYPDPLHNTKQRYWNGHEWEQHAHASGLVTVGYLLAVLMPAIGFVIGVIAATRTDEPATKVHGPYIVLASVLCAGVWFWMVGR